jgi:uncharacterized repeat protein (TIGR01451 family)
MRPLINIILVLIILVGLTLALEYQSHLDVRGNGYIYANSNSGLAKDRVIGQGDQSYDRSFMDKSERSLFLSDYSLNASFGHISRYSIISSPLNGPAHFMEVSSGSEMMTANLVDLTKNGISTEFQARTGTKGGLVEEVVDINSSMKHPNTLVETRADGIINFTSGLKNNATSKIEESQMNKLDSVIVRGEVARQEIFTPTTEINVNGQTVNVKEDMNRTVSVGNTNFEMQSKGSIDFGDSDKLETTKRKYISDFKEINGIGIIKQVENPQILLVEGLAAPNNGSIGTIVDLKINMTNYGKLGLTGISIVNKLPIGMDFVESPDGVYSDGYVKWPVLEHLDAYETRTFSFKARVNQEAMCSSILINEVLAQGRIISSGDIQEAKEFINFTLETPPTEEIGANAENQTLGGLYGASLIRNLILSVKAEPELSVSLVARTANQDYVYTDDTVSYDVTIKNSGITKLSTTSVDAYLDFGFELVKASNPTYSSTATAGKTTIHWADIGSIEAGKTENLTYVIRVTGANIDGAELNNTVIAIGTDINNVTTTPKTNNSKIIYSEISTATEANGYLIVKMKKQPFEEREPLTRQSIHLGNLLIWDRHAYAGWKEMRNGDEYFITNKSDLKNASQRIWYNPQAGRVGS